MFLSFFFHFLSFFHCLSFSFILFHFLSFSIIFFHFLSFSFIFYHFLSLSFIFFHFIFFHFLSFSFIFVHFLSFSFISFFSFHFLSFSFIFVHFLSFSFIFFHILSFSFLFFPFLSFSFIFFHFHSFSFIFFVFVGCSKSDVFLCLNFVTISLDSSYVKHQFLGPPRVAPPLGPLFIFSYFFFLPFVVFLLAFYFFIFSHFLFISSFFDFLMFFIFSFFRKKKVSSFLFFVFLSNILNCWLQYQSLTVSSVVGAPSRCGVLTTWGGIAGIGLSRLLGGEHASTPQSGVEAPRLLKRSLSRLYYCCCCSERIIIVKWTDLSDFFFRWFSSENVCFCFTSNENCHFSSEKRVPPKTGCWSSSGKRHSEKKSWKS